MLFHGDIVNGLKTATAVFALSLFIVALALALTYIHLKLAEIKIKKKIDRRMKDPGKIKKMFELIDKRNEKFEERKKKEKEIFLEKIRSTDYADEGGGSSASALKDQENPGGDGL